MTGYLAAWRALPRAQLTALVLLAMGVALANVDQPYPAVAPLQHIPTILLIVAAPLLLRRWPLSAGAVWSVAAFFLLHTVAGRWIYSNVPYDAWAHALTGHTINAMVGATRNDFDRLVHLSFGLLAIRPVAEAMRRHAGMRPAASLWTAFLFVGAVSALYEIFEWVLMMVLAPELADDYNGQQGDVWDAQKDMAIAIAGAAISYAAEMVRSRRGSAGTSG
jgi:putative membrane protein